VLFDSLRDLYVDAARLRLEGRGVGVLVERMRPERSALLAPSAPLAAGLGVAYLGEPLGEALGEGLGEALGEGLGLCFGVALGEARGDRLLGRGLLGTPARRVSPPPSSLAMVSRICFSFLAMAMAVVVVVVVSDGE
jgi:hypothetical protein